MQQKRSLYSGLLVIVTALILSVSMTVAQTTAPARGVETSDPLAAAIAKSNAYIELLNRTLRAVESLNRYASWVNMKSGPTGKERYITYGLYSLYDTRSVISKARDAISKQPVTPDLDASVERYVNAYEALAPIITRAYGYYSRQDYRDDKMAEGKALHTQLVPAATAFLKERDTLERQMRVLTGEINQRELAAIEKREGKSSAWHTKSVRIAAVQMIEMLPSGNNPRVDIKAFDEALARFAATVRTFDEFHEANPELRTAMGSRPRSMLAKLREYREALAKAKGDGRRAGPTNWIIFDYNSLIR